MEPYRASRVQSRISRLACRTAVLLGIAMLAHPNLVIAADGKAGGDAVSSVVRGPSFDRRELPEPEPSTGSAVLLRGTRPSKPNASQLPPAEAGAGYAGANNAFQEGPSNPYWQRQNNTFQQSPLSGSGWDTRYDYGGLSGTYFLVPQ